MPLDRRAHSGLVPFCGLVCGFAEVWRVSGNKRRHHRMPAVGASLLWAVRFALLRLLQSAYLCVTAWSALRARARLLLPSSLHALAQPPAHLGIVLGDGELEVVQLAKLVGWCVTAGIERMTICDVHGEAAVAPRILCNALRSEGVCVTPAAEAKPKHPSSPDAPLTAVLHGEDPELSLRLISLQTGRDDLVGSTRRLCRQVRQAACGLMRW